MSANHSVFVNDDDVFVAVDGGGGIRIEWGTGPDVESVTFWFDTAEQAQRLSTVFNEARSAAFNISRAIRTGV